VLMLSTDRLRFYGPLDHVASCFRDLKFQVCVCVCVLNSAVVSISIFLFSIYRRKPASVDLSGSLPQCKIIIYYFVPLDLLLFFCGK